MKIKARLRKDVIIIIIIIIIIIYIFYFLLSYVVGRAYFVIGLCASV
jgi:hypothetical protein